MAYILELSQYLMQELFRNLSPILSNIIYRHGAFASYAVLLWKGMGEQNFPD